LGIDRVSSLTLFSWIVSDNLVTMEPKKKTGEANTAPADEAQTTGTQKQKAAIVTPPQESTYQQDEENPEEHPEGINCSNATPKRQCKRRQQCLLHPNR
jgi:hypothetical protein